MPYYPSGGAAGLPLGLAGATGATRYVGGTATGAPGSGTFSLGDYVIDQTGKVQVCTVAGSPGTWAAVGGVSWPLTNSGDEAFQPNSVANSVLTLHNNATAVNLVTLTGTATGTDPTLVVSGDANRGLVINPAGTGTITVGGGAVTGVPLTVAGFSSSQTGNLLNILQNPGGNAVLTVATASTVTNGVTITGTATAGTPTIVSSGTDTNIGMGIKPKGTGTVTITGGAATAPGTALTVAGVNSAVNGITVTNAATGSGPTIAATGGDTDIAITVDGKGGGAVTALQTTTAGQCFVGGTAGSVIMGSNSATTSVLIQCKPNANVSLGQGTHPVLIAAGVTSQVNGVTVTSAIANSAPSIAATGSDTNIDLVINAKGTGVVNIGPASAAAISGSVGPATLATTTGGATGPGTAAQNQWLKIKINGTINYIPAWQ